MSYREFSPGRVAYNRGRIGPQHSLDSKGVLGTYSTMGHHEQKFKGVFGIYSTPGPHKQQGGASATLQLFKGTPP